MHDPLDKVKASSGGAAVVGEVFGSPRHAPFPLTDVQRAYLAGRSEYFALGNVACHVYFEFTNPHFSHHEIEAAWQRLVDRHDMLRAVVRPDGRQQVLPQVPQLAIPHTDLARASEAEVAAHLNALRGELSHQILPADGWPPLDLRTTALPDRNVFHFSLDLLFVDLWSMQILFDELTLLLVDDSTYFEPFSINFRDYVLHMESHRGSERYARAKAYWQDRIPQMDPGPVLPLAKRPSQVTRPHFVRYQHSFDAAAYRRLKKRAREEGISVSALLMAAFSKCLAEWTGQDGFTINVTVFQREMFNPDVARMVGDFTSIVLLGVEHRPTEPFRDFARRLSAGFRKDLEHRDYSGIDVMGALRDRLPPQEFLTIPVVFTSALTQAMPGWRHADDWGDLTYGITQTPQVALDHQVYERGGVLHLTWDVVEELFDKDELGDVFAGYGEFVRGLADRDAAWTALDETCFPKAPPAPEPVAETDPGAAQALAILRDHPMVASAKAHGTSVDLRLRGSSAPAPGGAAPFADRTAGFPDDAGDSAELTAFGATLDRLDRIAVAAMAETLVGLGCNDLAMPLSAEGLVHGLNLDAEYETQLGKWLTHLAAAGLCEKTGDGYGPISAADPAVNEADIAAVRREHPELLTAVTSFFEALPDILTGRQSALEVMYRAGTTGTAELIYADNPLSRRINFDLTQALERLVAGGDGPIRVLEIGAGTGSLTRQMVSALPPGRTDYAFTDVSAFFFDAAATIAQDHPFVTARQLDAFANLATQGLVPGSFDLILASNVLHIAPNLPAALTNIRRLLRHGGAIGIVEATRNTALQAATVGFIEGLHGGAGEVEGPFLPKAAWLAGLEDAGFRDVAATGAGDALGLAAFLGRASGPTPEDHASFFSGWSAAPGLHAYLGWHLPEASIPDIRIAGAERPRAAPAAAAPLEIPADEVEARVAAIWGEILGHAVGLDDDFLSSGGDSLLAVRLIARIRDEFGVELRAQDLFHAPTPRTLAQRIGHLGQRAAGPAAGETKLVPDWANRSAPFPLTDIQTAYWVGSQGGFALSGVGAHFYVEIDAKDIDLPRFEAAWQTLTARHGMLRTVVRKDGLQAELDHVPRYTIEETDLTHAGPDAVDRALAFERRRMSHQVFDGQSWPPFEIRAVRTSKTGHRLLFSFDLIFVDLWSLRVLLGELMALYHAPALELPEIGLSFRDYVLGVRDQRNGPDYQDSWDYWQARIPDLPAAPNLPLAVPPETLDAPVFTRRETMLDAEAWSAIKSIATDHQLTASCVLLAAFSEVLASWSKSTAFTVNLTVFQRLPIHDDVDRLVGDFTTTLPLAVDHGAAASFLHRAKGLQAQLLSDLDHTAVSGVEILRELAVQRGLRGFPVVFTSGLAEGMPELSRLEQGSLRQFGEVAYSITQTPQVWLDHQVYEEDGALRFNWDVVDALFPPGLIDAMFDAYRAGLDRLARDAEIWRRPGWHWHDPPEISPMNPQLPAAGLHDDVYKNAVAHPDRVAVIDAEGEFGYGEITKRADHVAALLQAAGVTPGDRVVVTLPKGWAQVVGVLAVLRAGAAFVPVDPDWPQARQDRILANTGAAAVLSRKGVAAVVPDGAPRIDVPETAPKTPQRPAPVPTGPDDLAYVIYTSGSSGEPKGVAIDHGAALNTVRDINDRFGIGPEDRVLALSALTFDLAIYDIFGLLGVGGTIVMPPPESAREPADWADLIARHRVTVWNSVPALMQMLADHRRDGHYPLKCVMLSGDWIPTSLPDAVRRIAPGATVVGLGGATEASIWSIYHIIGTVDPGLQSIPYGRALHRQQMWVLDDTLRPCPIWAVGQIAIGGVGLARGYWNDPERSARQFVTHPSGARLYLTGDLGRSLPNGEIEFLGRDDGQTKVQGYRIELGEVEAALTRIEGVRQAVAFATGTSGAGRMLVACCVAPGLTTEDIRAQVAREVPAYMVPAKLTLIDALPLTGNGKVDRKALADLHLTPKDEPGAAPDANAAPAAPQEALAQVLALIEAEVGVAVGPEDNLLNLGASSLELVRIVARFEEEFGFRPSMESFFNDPRALALAKAVEAQREPRATQTSAPQSRAIPVLSEPFERDAFRAARNSIRTFGEGWSGLPLPDPASDIQAIFDGRRTPVRFDSGVIDQDAVARLLSVLADRVGDAKKRRAYASAGQSYPVQTYLHVKTGAVDGLPGGTYYHDPAAHRVVPLATGVDLDPTIHEPFTNRPLFEAALFSLFLVDAPQAIEPLYGEFARDYSLLEAGAMAHSLQTAAARTELALCPIGWIDFASVAPHLHLQPGQRLLHSMLGGIRPGGDGEAWEEVVL